MKRLFHLSGALFCCLFVFTTNFSSFAQPGSLDPLFGEDGSGRRFILDFNLYYVGNKTLEMPDGKILISGTGATDNGNQYTPFVARLLPNGDTDVDFADLGFIRNEAPLTFDINCWSLIRQPDGKIVQSGRYYNLETGRYDLYIMRYLENGLLDDTFGENNNGMVIKTIPGYSIRYTIDLLLQPDGKIVAPGSKVVLPEDASTLIYFRYLPDGSPDPEFGTNGVAEIDLGYAFQNTGFLELLPDGKIIGAGNIISDQFEYQNLIVRLNPDGTLDNTFGDGGSTIFNYVSTNQSITTDLKVTADGRILVAGYVEDVNGNAGLNFAIARFNSDGSIDESFGDDGYRILDWDTSSEQGSTIDIQPDGKILFAGVKSDNFLNILIFRLNEDGSTDSDFGVNGAVVIDDEVYGPSIAVQSNGTALISGQGHTHVPGDKPAFYIARMLLDLNVGTLAPGTGNSELLFYPNPVKDHTVLEYELLTDQDVDAAVYTTDGALVGICLPKSRQSAGKHQAPLHMASGLKAGTYLLKITTDDVVKTVKFTKI